MARFKLKGSERRPLEGSRALGKADPNERLEVSLLLRRRDDAALRAHVAGLFQGDTAAKPLSREDFASRHGADPQEAHAIRTFAEAHGLVVVQQHLARRTVVLAGTVAQFNAAFGVDLQQYEYANGSYRGREGAITLPTALQDIVEGVFGLDNRPQAKPHFRIFEERPTAAAAPMAKPKASPSFTPVQLAALYDFPNGTGSGQCIAIIELGGGYRSADLQTYFSGLGLKTPTVVAVSVDHAGNKPTGNANGPDGEVVLDIEVAGAVAPDARLAVYFAPNTDAGFLDAITTAIHDTTNQPSVISISWGGPESSWTAQAMNAYDQAFQAAAALGITVCAASGDNGSSDGVNDGQDHVDFPASSPHVLACGGTSLTANGGKIASESVWNDGSAGGAGGGGVSTVFALPSYQQGLKASKNGAASALTMRGVPDISGDADPATGYQVRVDGQSLVFGGTSAVAPLWAGLIARINALKGQPLGFLHPKLYANAKALRDITQGNNGDFVSTSGWDACTGLGSPDGAKVVGLFSGNEKSVAQ